MKRSASYRLITFTIMNFLDQLMDQLYLQLDDDDDQYPGLKYPFEDWDLNETREYDLNRYLHLDAKLIKVNLILPTGGKFLVDYDGRRIKLEDEEDENEEEVGGGVCEVTISMNGEEITYSFYILSPDQEFGPSPTAPE